MCYSTYDTHTTCYNGVAFNLNQLIGSVVLPLGYTPRYNSIYTSLDVFSGTRLAGEKYIYIYFFLLNGTPLYNTYYNDTM